MSKYIIRSGILISSMIASIFTLNAQESKKDSVYTYKEASSHGTGKFYMDREIARIISSTGSGWLDRSTRQEEENSNLAVEKMQLKPTDVVADIGAGTGYYSFKIAKYVPQGKVYAVEIQDPFLKMLNDRIRDSSSKNMEVIKGGEQTPNLPENSVDCALMVDVYHELMYPKEMLQAIAKSLKKGGRLILMEYRAEDAEIGILKLHKTSEKQIKKELEANGFRMVSNGKFLPIQHFFIFTKTAD
ncbi:class I SAM-dependent methyltransferase [Pollutibacter soli]|uniref:class I SAM-dependent methyltransferase n=1 Tax=Pollutibacter soli TaxID=3034157 RepID=UPI0030134A07